MIQIFARKCRPRGGAATSAPSSDRCGSIRLHSVRPKCNLRSPHSFTAYGACVRRDARGGDCLPRPLRMAVAKKFHLAPDLSERAAPRPADDAVAMLHASSGRLECDPWPNRQCLSLNGEPAEPFFSSAGGLVQFVAVSAAPMPYARPACLQRRK